MGRINIGIGNEPNDGTGDPLRSAFDKTNTNFTSLYSVAIFLSSIVNSKFYAGENPISIPEGFECVGVYALVQGLWVPKEFNIVGENEIRITFIETETTSVNLFLTLK